MSNRLWRSVLALSVVVPAVFASTIAVAADLTVTGFGTIGYARSDQDFQYLRYIDNGGTLKADSLVGVQAEAQFSSQWGATLQAVASAPRTRDEGYEAKIRWAFISFRPDNDWLFRAGRLRTPVLINTQNAEVGVTYDQARLPVEVYSLIANFDFDGGALAKTWRLDDAEINIDAYWGKSDVKFRLFQRDTAQPEYIPLKYIAKGLILSYTAGSLFLRGGVHRVTFESGNEQPLYETYSPIAVPGPPPFGGPLYLPYHSLLKADVSALTLGADWHLGDWRITGEYAQRKIPDFKLGQESKSAYVTVARRFGKWTPYLTYARLLSGSNTREVYQAVNGTPVPLGAQLPPPVGPGLPANFHRMLADRMTAYDQYSNMLGASYSFSATSKLKFEWMRTKVGLASSLVDGDVHDKRFNVFSVSYSMAF